MLERRRARGAQDERGAAAVEFAVVVPFLLLVVVGVVSYGYLLGFRQTLSQAAAEGARSAVAHAGAAVATGDPLSVVDAAVGGYDVVCNEGALSCDLSEPYACESEPGVDDAECVSVTVRYDYAEAPLTPAFPGLDLVLPDVLEYTAAARVS